VEKKSVSLVAVLWCFTILLALGVGAGVGWHLALTTASQAAAAVPVKPAPAAAPAPERTAAQAPNDGAAPPDEEPASDENDRLRVAFRQALKQVVDRNAKQPGAAAAPPRIQSLWDRAYARWKQRKDSGMFGGLDENMNLMADMSRTGAPGMKFLASLVGDGQRPMDERELALGVLSHIQDGAALGAILQLNAPDVTELDYPYDLIETQVASLPTREVRPYIAQIVEQANRDLDLVSRDPAPERAEVLTILALVHGDARAQGLLHDERILQEDLIGAVQTANEIHTSAARQYVEWIAANHPNANVQQSASVALQGW
jgi:hypothetical protein